VSFNDCEDPLPGHAAVWWPDAVSIDGTHAVSVALGEQGRLRRSWGRGCIGGMRCRASTCSAPPAPSGAGASSPVSRQGRPQPAPFNDVGSDAVHAEGIACADALGVARGQIDGLFRPGVRVTSAQFASLLVRAMTVAGTAPLDAPGPGDWVTRGQMATALDRAYGAITGGARRRGPDRWIDDDGSVHEPGLDALGLAGVLGGTTPTQVSPGRAVRRDGAATAVARLIDRTLRDR
jgi:hypothetical protein